MLKEEEVFFDAKEELDYDIWLSEPESVNERRNNFLSRMGFQFQSSVMGLDSLLLERRNSNREANCSFDYSEREWFDDNVEREVNETKVFEDNYLRDDSNEKKNQIIQWLKEKSRLAIRVNKSNKQRRYVEKQRVKSHNGLIWTMKISPDGQFLASGGEDGVVCVRRVYVNNKSTRASFHLEEEVLHEFKGHSSDVLDLAWSSCNHLLSTSMDKTVRLWHVDSDECLGVFHHNNYVTCVQFNPVDEHYFISGSIDGIVRVWSIPSGRVDEWAKVGNDIVTAVCYQPNGKGFVVGTLSGNCRFYKSSWDELVLNEEINIGGKKKSSSNKITSIQFLNNDSRRLMITSKDSKIRVLDGLEVILKYKGQAKSGSQTCATLTSSGRHIVSLGEEDSRVYIWNYDDLCIQTQPKPKPKSSRSCESFISQGASVVIPLLDLDVGHDYRAPTRPITKSASERVAHSNWFSKHRATWPEEKLLPLRDLLSPEYDGSMTRGLVFVAANYDGTITTFHSYDHHSYYHSLSF